MAEETLKLLIETKKKYGFKIYSDKAQKLVEYVVNEKNELSLI